jgi:hypothetical protein
VAFVSPPAALHLSMLALGVFAESVTAVLRRQLDVSQGVGRPFGDPRPGQLRAREMESKETIPIGAPLVGFAPLRRMRSGESTSRRLAATDYGAAHAVFHDFSGLLLTQPSGLLR